MTSTEAITQADILSKLQQPQPTLTGTLDHTPALVRHYITKPKQDETDGISKNFSDTGFLKSTQITTAAQVGVGNLGPIIANGSFATENSLAVQIHQLETRTQLELRRLSETVSKLGRLIEARPSEYASSVPSTSVLHVDYSMLSNAPSNLERIQLLDGISDLKFSYTDDALNFMLEGLKSESPELRGAAAKALSVVASSDSISSLKVALNKETNKFVASFIRSAIMAAEA